MASASTGFGPGLYDDGREHPIWRSFNESLRRALVQEDLGASRGAATVLIGAVSLGVVLGVAAVLIACL
jgi:hypothetical protein